MCYFMELKESFFTAFIAELSAGLRSLTIEYCINLAAIHIHCIYLYCR